MPSGPTSNSSTHRSEEFIGTKSIWSSRNKYQVSQKSSPSIYFRPSASIEEAIGASSSKFPADCGSEFDNGFVEARYSRTCRYYENQSVRPSVRPSRLSVRPTSRCCRTLCIFCRYRHYPTASVVCRSQFEERSISQIGEHTTGKKGQRCSFNAKAQPMFIPAHDGISAMTWTDSRRLPHAM